MRSNSIIIDGKNIALEILNSLKHEVILLEKKYSIIPTLCIIQVGNNPASSLYIRNKILKAKTINIHIILNKYSEHISEKELINEINLINQNNSIHGLIVQLPLPSHINENNISVSVDPKKDVDGLHPTNIGNLSRNNKNSLTPCTALGCLYLLKKYVKNLKGQNIVIIGRSNIVGKPLAMLLTNEDATVTLCHSYSKNIKEHTTKADIVISAVGSPRLFDHSYFHNQSIFIDVGISKINNKIYGDGDFNDLIDKISIISPVPGGVGPMTIAFLMKNIIQAVKIQINQTN